MRTERKGLIRQGKDTTLTDSKTKKPWAVVVAEIFLLFVLCIYVAKICVLSMGILAEGNYTPISWNFFVFLCEIAMLFITADSMLGLSSKRPIGWKKAVRGSMLLMLFTLIATYLNVADSVSALVTIKPIVVAPIVALVIILMMLPSVRDYYVPPMEERRSLVAWIKFSLFWELYPSGKYRVSYPGKTDRNISADDYVNCVVKRSNRDMLLKPSLMITSIVVPMIVGLAVALVILAHDTTVDQPHFSGELVNSCGAIAIITAVVVEMSIMSFMTFCVARRNRNHLRRDMEWMESLCGYVESHGRDASDMRDILKKCRNRTGNAVTMFSMGIWIVTIAVLVVLGFFAQQVTAEAEAVSLLSMVAMVLLPVTALLIIQFISTIGVIYRFPSKHDHLQCKFVEELKERCYSFGLVVEPMEHTVKRRMTWIHIILTFLTLGLYSLIYIAIACREMNRHLIVQWKYEERLMRDIIRFEGGDGIESTEEGAPGTVAKVLGNLM